MVVGSYFCLEHIDCAVLILTSRGSVAVNITDIRKHSVHIYTSTPVYSSKDNAHRHFVRTIVLPLNSVIQTCAVH